jgi:hypothetical protein
MDSWESEFETSSFRHWRDARKALVRLMKDSVERKFGSWNITLLINGVDPTAWDFYDERLATHYDKLYWSADRIANREIRKADKAREEAHRLAEEARKEAEAERRRQQDLATLERLKAQYEPTNTTGE